MSQLLWNNVEIKLYQRYFNVVSTADTDVVSTFCKVEYPTLDCVFFSKSNQRSFNVDPTLQCCLGNKQPPLITYFILNSKNIVIVLPSRQILVPRTSPSNFPRTFTKDPIVLSWHPVDVPTWRPRDISKWRQGGVIIWRPRKFPWRLIREVHGTFSGRSLNELENTS